MGEGHRGMVAENAARMNLYHVIDLLQATDALPLSTYDTPQLILIIVIMDVHDI